MFNEQVPMLSVGLPQPSPFPSAWLRVRDSITPALKNLQAADEGLHLEDANSSRLRLDCTNLCQNNQLILFLCALL